MGKYKGGMKKTPKGAKPGWSGTMGTAKKAIKPAPKGRRMEARGKHLKAHFNNKRAFKAQYDLWADPIENRQELDEVDPEEFGKDITGIDNTGNFVKQAKSRGQRSRVLTRERPREYNPKRVSGRSACVLPHNGMSYNPDPAALAEAQDIAVQNLIKIEKTDARWSKKIEVNKEIKNKHYNEAIDKGWSEDELISETVIPKKKKRKTEQDRNKTKRKERAQTLERLRKTRTKREKQIDRLDQIQERIQAQAEVDAELEEAKKKMKAVEDALKVHKFGDTKYHFKTMPVLETSEVKKNLRRQTMHNAGTNPMVERMDSYYQRNLLPVRRKYEKQVGKRQKPGKKFFFVLSQ